MADKDLEDLRKLGQSAQDDDDLKRLRDLGDDRSQASQTWDEQRRDASTIASTLEKGGTIEGINDYSPSEQETNARLRQAASEAADKRASIETYKGPQTPADLKSIRYEKPSDLYTPQTPGLDRLTQDQGTSIDDFANSFAAERYFANWRNDSVIGNYLASPDSAEILRKEQRRRLALKQDQQGLLGEMGVSLTMRLGENVLRSPLPGAIDKLLPDIRRPLSSDFLSKEESDAEIKRRYAEKQAEVTKIENDFRSLQQRSREGEVIQPAADTATKMYATATGEDIQGLEQKLAKERRNLVNLKMMAEDDDAPLMKTWWRAGVENTAEAITRGMIDLTVKFPAIAAHYAENGIGPKIIDDHLAPLVLTNDPAESPLYKWGLALDKMAHSMFPGDEVRKDDFVQKTFSGLGSMIPFMGTGMLAAKAGLGPLGVGLTASITGGMQEAPQGFEKATEQMKLAKEAFEQNPAWKGFTPTERDRALMFAAYFAIGTTEGLPMANMFKTSGRGLKGRAQHALREGFEEGAQEGVQSVLEDLADWYYLRDPKAWFEDTAENAAVGAILGLSMGTLFSHSKRPLSKLEKDVKAALKGADIDTFQNVRAYLDAELADDPVEVKQRFDTIFDEAWRTAGADTKAKQTESGTQPQQTMTDAEPEAIVDGQQEAKLHAKPDVKTAPAPEAKPEEQKPEIAKPPVVEQVPAGDLFATPKTVSETVSKEIQALIDAGFDEAQARKALAAIQPEAAKRSEVQPQVESPVSRETLVKEGLTTEPAQVGQEQEITTPDGQMKVKARFEVVELADLEHASGDFQPRDRSRKESDVQTRALAFNLDPARLQPARTSDIGAPIASEDGTIMSGNGRVMAIRKIYQDPTLGFKEKEYRASLGPAAENMIAPVGIMRIAEPMTHADLVRFADLSNRIAIAGMSETERALRDARSMGPEAMQLYTGGSFTSPANKEFFRLFMAKAVASSERGEVSKDGVLTQAGERRLRNAVLAAAYPDADLLSKMLESTDDNIRAISRAMLETASKFIKLKQAIERGEVKPEFDITKEIGAAARLISENRDKGVKPREFLAQQDAFNALDPITESLIRVFYNEELTRAVSAEKMIDALGWYADEAMKKKADDFFGDVTAPTDVLAKAKGKISETIEGQGDLLASGEGTLRAGTQEGGPEAPGPANDAGGPASDAGQRIAALATERERDTRPAGERLLEHLRAGGSLSSRRAMAKELDLEPRVLNAEIGKALERGWLRRGPDGSLRRVPEAYQDGEQDLRLEMREASLSPEGLGIELNGAINELEDWLKERESGRGAQDNRPRVLEARQGQSARRGEEAPRGTPGASLFALARQERGRGDRSVRSVEGRNYQLPQPRADVRVYVSGSIGDEQGVKQRIYRLYTADKSATPDQDLKTLGRPAAFARIIERAPGRWEVLMTETDPAHRRKGFNRLLHNAIDADLGAPMQPSGTLTEDGYAFWKQRDPVALEHHRLYIPAGINGSEGALWLSPKGIAKLKAEFDDLAVMAAENGDMQAVQAYARENAELNRLLESIDWQKVDAPMLDMMFALTAYHGSPHRFDRFDIGKIGSGEGNQAFGYGLYFAENEKTAQFYRDALTPKVGDEVVFVNGHIGSFDDDIAYTYVEGRGNLKDAISSATERASEYRKWKVPEAPEVERAVTILKGWQERGAKVEKRAITESDLEGFDKGHVYEVSLKVEPDEILDHTAPVKDQGPAIQKVAADLKLTPNATGYSLYDTMVRRIALEHRGRISRGIAQQEASKRLLAAGIKGVKYKDSGSRNRNKAAATYNYVIFDDKVIDITARNGEKLPEQMPEPMLFSLAPSPASFAGPPRLERQDYDRLADAVPTTPRPLGNGLSLIAEKGRSLRYSIVPEGATSSWDENGDSIAVGRFLVRPGQNGGLEVTNAMIEAPYRSQGLGTKVYDIIEKDFPGVALMPSPWNQLSPAAFNFWSKRAPAKLAYQRASLGFEPNSYPERVIGRREPDIENLFKLADGTPETRDAPDFGTPAYRANRPFTIGGETIIGYDKALAYIRGVFEQHAGESGVRAERQAVLVLGPPGSGKSTVVGPITRSLGAAAISSDDPKFIIPEFRTWGAQGVHEEASLIAKMVQSELLADGTNVLIEKLGDNQNSIKGLLDTLGSAGYQVRVVRVGAPKDELVKRIAKRAQRTGRDVPGWVLDQALAGIETTLQMVHGHPAVRGFVDVDNGGTTAKVVKGAEVIDGLQDGIDRAEAERRQNKLRNVDNGAGSGVSNLPAAVQGGPREASVRSEPAPAGPAAPASGRQLRVVPGSGERAAGSLDAAERYQEDGLHDDVRKAARLAPIEAAIADLGVKVPEEANRLDPLIRYGFELLPAELEQRLIDVLADELAPIPGSVKVRGVLRHQTHHILAGALGGEFMILTAQGVLSGRTKPLIMHEAVHIVRALKGFSGQEWRSLVRYAEKAGVFDAVPDPETGLTWRQRYEQSENYVSLREKHGDAFFKEKLDEEQVALLAERYAEGERFAKRANTLLSRLVRFFKRVHNAILGHGYQTSEEFVDDILERLQSGQTAQRLDERERAASASNENFMSALSPTERPRLGANPAMVAAMREKAAARQPSSENAARRPFALTEKTAQKYGLAPGGVISFNFGHIIDKRVSKDELVNPIFKDSATLRPAAARLLDEAPFAFKYESGTQYSLFMPLNGSTMLLAGVSFEPNEHGQYVGHTLFTLGRNQLAHKIGKAIEREAQKAEGPRAAQDRLVPNGQPPHLQAQGLQQSQSTSGSRQSHGRLIDTVFKGLTDVDSIGAAMALVRRAKEVNKAPALDVALRELAEAYTALKIAETPFLAALSPKPPATSQVQRRNQLRGQIANLRAALTGAAGSSAAGGAGRRGAIGRGGQPGQPSEAAGTEPAQRSGPDRHGGEGDVRPSLGGVAISREDPDWLAQLKRLTFQSPEHKERARAQGFDVDRPMYHGTRVAGYQDIQESKFDVGGLRGPGHYMTDEPRVAGGSDEQGFTRYGYTALNALDYAGAPSPGVYKLVHRVQNPFDTDTQKIMGDWLPPVYAKGWPKEGLAYDGAGQRIIKAQVTSWMNAPVETLKALVSNDAFKAPKTILRDALKKQGYDGITHEGGLITKGAKHRVVIAFDANQVRAINAEFDEGRRNEPVLLAALTKPLPGQPHRIAKPGAGTAAPEMGLSEIMRKVIRELGLTVRQGNLDKALKRASKAAGKDLQGQYNRDTGVIRQAVFNDIHVFAHEAGHALEQRLGTGLKVLLQSHFGEIRSFLPNTNTGPLLPTADILSEGFSEFFRAFLTNPLAARSKATSFYPLFVDLLERRQPQMLKSLEEAQMRIKEFYAASSAGVAQTIIADPKAKRGIEKFTQEAIEMGFVDAVKLRLSNAYTYVFDRANPFWHGVYRLLQVLEENTGKRIDLKVGENAYKLLRLMPHSAAWAQRDLLDGVRARDKARGSGPSLMSALKLALGNDARIALETGPGSRYRKFGAYLVARRAVHLWAQYQAGELEREPVAMTMGDAQEAIRALEKEFPDFQKAAAQVYEYQKNLLALMRDAGIISDDTFDDLTTNPKHKDYVPFLRSFEERGESAKTGGKTDVKKRAEVMKKLRGSQRDIIDPIASIAQKTYEVRQLIALNDVKMALIRLAETAGPGGGEIAERLDPNKGKIFEVSVRDALRNAAKDAGVDPHDTAQLIDMATTLMGEDATALMFQNGKLQAGRENIIWALEKGKPVPIRLSDGWIGKTMLESLAAFGPEHTNWLERALATPAHVLRGAIASHPSFMLRNIWIDGFMGAMYEPRALPWVTQIKGFVKAVREDADVKEYGHNAGLMGGAAVAGFEKLRLDRDVSALLKKGWKVWPWDSPGLFAGIAMTGVATGTILSMPVAGAGLLAVGGAGLVAAKLRGHKVLRSIAETSEASETGVRTELYRIAKQRALAQGLNEAEAAQEAAFYAHDYLDYSNHGSKMGAWSRLVSFMNAAMQAQSTYARWLTAQGDRGSAFRAYFEYLSGNGGPLSPREKRDLGRSAWVWFMTAAVFGTISAVIKAVWGDDDRLDEIPERLKATHWIIPINGIVHLIPKEYPGLREALDSKTKNVVLRAPKPFETAWVANFVERVHEGYAKNNPRWLEHYASDLWETLHPPMEPQALQMYYELRTGKNFFTGQDILPRTQANRLREGQFHEYTSEFAKWLGKKTDTSPVYIDHAMNGVWSTWAKDATSLNVPGLPWYNPNKAEAGLDEMFIARRFLWNVGKGTESARHVREAMGNEDPFESVWNRLTTNYSKLQSSSNTFGDYLKRRDHGSAMELLDRLTPRERGYAILDTFATGDAAKLKQVDPMKRAQTIAIEIGSLQKEIISDKILDKKAQGIKGLVKGKGDEEVPLGPSEKRVANDILRQITLAETHNALVVTGEYGYAKRRLIDAAPLYRELELAVPKVHEELLKRQKKEHVLPFEGVKAVWPDVKKKLEDPDIQRQIRAQDYDGIRRLVAPEFANARGY